MIYDLLVGHIFELLDLLWILPMHVNGVSLHITHILLCDGIGHLEIHRLRGSLASYEFAADVSKALPARDGVLGVPSVEHGNVVLVLVGGQVDWV